MNEGEQVTENLRFEEEIASMNSVENISPKG
jgi:hypothetical protein